MGNERARFPNRPITAFQGLKCLQACCDVCLTASKQQAALSTWLVAVLAELTVLYKITGLRYCKTMCHWFTSVYFTTIYFFLRKMIHFFHKKICVRLQKSRIYI